jgi:uncharacterized coiled-coil protein SlyX
MRNRACSIALRLAKAVSRKALVIATVSGLAVVGAGTLVWTHRAYAAKVRAERAAQAQAATLNDVIAKLNHIESEMQQQTRMLNAKLRAVEYQNAKLATYEVRTHADAAKFELAAARMPLGGQLSSSFSQSSPASTDYWEKKTCFHVGLDAAIKANLDMHGKGEAKGNVGAEAVGDGVDASLHAKVEGGLAVDIGPTGNVEIEVCHTWDQSSSSSSSGATAMDFSNISTSAPPIPPDLQAKITHVFSEFSEFQPSSIENGVDALTNMNLDVSPQKVLQIVEDPSNALSDVHDLASSLPMPAFLRNLTTDPSPIHPKFSNLNPKNFCSDFSPTGGPLSKICVFIPTGLTDLQTIAKVGKDVQNVQGALVNFQTTLSKATAGFSSLCGSASNVVTGLNGVSVSIPRLATLSIPDGISWNGLLAHPPVSLSYYTASIGPQTIPSPFHFQPISCPAF